MKIYVIYSGEKPKIPEKSVLTALYSPVQNYSELWAQRQIREQSGELEEHLGFFHFRRYLDLEIPIIEALEKVGKKVPYSFRRFPHDAKYGLVYANSQVESFDIIAPLPERTGISVRTRYGKYKNHRKEDLEIAVQLMLERYPEYSEAAEAYLLGKEEYYGNIYIMRRKILNEYLDWLFSILGDFDVKVSEQLSRTPGYLAERLFGIWMTRQAETRRYRCGWCPRVHFYGYDDSAHHFRRNKWINLLLPPESRRRICVKRLVQAIR